MGDFRLGECAPGHDQRFRAGIAQSEGMWEERILNDDLRHGIRGMGKFVSRTNVAGGIDARVRRLEPVIYCHAEFVIFNPDGFQAQPLDVRRPAGTHQNFVDGHVVLLPV